MSRVRKCQHCYNLAWSNTIELTDRSENDEKIIIWNMLRHSNRKDKRGCNHNRIMIRLRKKKMVLPQKWYWISKTLIREIAWFCFSPPCPFLSMFTLCSWKGGGGGGLGSRIFIGEENGSKGVKGTGDPPPSIMIHCRNKNWMGIITKSTAIVERN